MRLVDQEGHAREHEQPGGDEQAFERVAPPLLRGRRPQRGRHLGLGLGLVLGLGLGLGVGLGFGLRLGLGLGLGLGFGLELPLPGVRSARCARMHPVAVEVVLRPLALVALAW